MSFIKWRPLYDIPRDEKTSTLSLLVHLVCVLGISSDDIVGFRTISSLIFCFFFFTEWFWSCCFLLGAIVLVFYFPISVMCWSTAFLQNFRLRIYCLRCLQDQLGKIVNRDHIFNLVLEDRFYLLKRNYKMVSIQVKISKVLFLSTHQSLCLERPHFL